MRGNGRSVHELLGGDGSIFRKGCRKASSNVERNLREEPAPLASARLVRVPRCVAFKTLDQDLRLRKETVMRRFFSWAICCAALAHTATAAAQQLSPITPNYGRSANRLASTQLPSPSSTLAVGTGLKEMVIPQQGSVNLGTGSATAPAPALPAYSYAPTPPLPTTAARAPIANAAGCSSCATGNCHGAGLGHSHCGPSPCAGNCGVGKLKSLLGKAHLGGHGGGWFGGFYYMNLSRAGDSFGQPLAYDSANPTTTVLSTGFARMEASDAFGLRLGKMINACSAVEFIYWQAFPDDKTAVADANVIGAPVSSFIDFGSLTYDNLGGGGAAPVNDFFTDAQYISVTRTYDYRNFELNFLKLPFIYGGNPCARARVALLAGVRYFRASEDLEFFSDDFNSVVGDDPANELRIHNELDNHLVGFQLGCLFDYQICNRLSGQIGSKVGIYNNHMRHVQSVTGGAGGAVVGAGAFAGQVVGLDTKKDDVAFLGELDAGLAYCINANWRLTGGYKVLGVSSYATSVRQIPRSYDNLAAAGLIQNEDSLILHGAYLGAEFCW